MGELEAVVVNFLGRRDDRTPSDVETAEVMRELAEAFREVAAEQGETLGWETREASKLDALCDRFLATDPSAGLRHSMVMAMGAYLGELMVRHGGGRWGYGSGDRKAVVVLANGLVCHPHDEVAQRLDLGPQLDLGFYFHYALAGRMGRDALAG